MRFIKQDQTKNAKENWPSLTPSPNFVVGLDSVTRRAPYINCIWAAPSRLGCPTKLSGFSACLTTATADECRQERGQGRRAIRGQVAAAGFRQAGKVQTTRWAGRPEATTAGRTPVTMASASHDDERQRRRRDERGWFSSTSNPNLAQSSIVSSPYSSNLLSIPIECTRCN